MQLSEFIQPTMVWPTLDAKNKLEVISELSANIASHLAAVNKNEIADALIKREELGSTGIEGGVAIPHAKIETLDKTVVAFGRKIEGIDFDAHDGKPTQLFFVLLAPTQTTTIHLKVLARLSKLLKNSDFRNQLLNANDASDIYNSIIKEDKNR